MKRNILTAIEAVKILMPHGMEQGDDIAGAQFNSGADVCEWLASHFGFTGEDYERLYFEEGDGGAMKRARAVAQWELGDPSWADQIISAFLNADDPGAREALEGIEGQ